MAFNLTAIAANAFWRKMTTNTFNWLNTLLKNTFYTVRLAIALRKAFTHDSCTLLLLLKADKLVHQFLLCLKAKSNYC